MEFEADDNMGVFILEKGTTVKINAIPMSLVEDTKVSMHKDNYEVITNPKYFKIGKNV